MSVENRLPVNAVVCLRTCRTAAVFIGIITFVFHPGLGQVRHIESAPPGIVEAGEPPLFVLGPQNLGLRSAPTDILRLPDGRIVLIAGSELALGDGIRWQIFAHESAEESVGIETAVVADDGTIYAGVPGGFGTLEIDETRRWRVEFEAPTTAELQSQSAIASSVVAVGDRWFWDSGSGTVVSWRPGESAIAVANPGIVERVFEFRNRFFLSDWGDGSLMRMNEDRFEVLIPSSRSTYGHVITSSVSFDDDHVLVGTHLRGMQLFDGTSLKPFVSEGPLSESRRINDVCRVEGGMFAAAIDNFGIAFFDRTGAVVQVVSRSIDRRLSRIRKLLPTPDGVVWALLDDGIACVRFPTGFTDFAPLISTPLLTVYPYRMNGKLWLLADGVVHRAVHDRNGILEYFEPDSPPGRLAFSLSMAPGWPLAGTEAGFYGRPDKQWVRLDSKVANGRIISDNPINERWLYAARGEVGWATIGDNKVDIESFPAPDLPEIHGARTGSDGYIWVELGSGIVARIDVRSPEPKVATFGPENGLPSNWVQVFETDGIVRMNAGGRVLRFREQDRMFVEDEEFNRRHPTNAPILGRPGRDKAGLLWMTTENGVYTFDNEGGSNLVTNAIRPIYFTFEDGGVVWMQHPPRLLRYDPSIPGSAKGRPNTVITSVHLPSSNRTFFTNNGPFGPLHSSDNSLEVAFLSTGDPFSSPVAFDVLLDGPSGTMTSSNISPPAVFNQLGEGDYTLRIKPRGGGSGQNEAVMAFTILAPWYRTTAAYLGYVALAFLVVVIVARSAAFVERREKARLEMVVSERTKELHNANRLLEGKIKESTRQADELRAGEERFRRLTEELEARVRERTNELNRANERLKASVGEMEAFSYSISHDLRAPLRNIRGFSDLLQKRAAPKLERESRRFLDIVSNEATRLNELIGSLLSFSRLNRAELKPVEVDLSKIVRAVIEEFRPEFRGRSIEWIFGNLPLTSGDPTLLRQVLANLIGNALKFTRGRSPARIEIGTMPPEFSSGEQVFFVRDNGVGFMEQYAEKAFGVFQRLHSPSEFEGTGIGLAIVRRIITRHGGRVWAEGTPDSGATIYFTLRPGPTPLAR